MELVTILQPMTTAEADLTVARLEAAGFDPVLSNALSALATGMPGASGVCHVQVPADQAEDARALLNDSTPVS